MQIAISGDITPIKKFMKEKRTEVVKAIRKLEKENVSDGKLQQLYIEKTIYSVSKTLPARYKGVVINVLLLERFLKKLDGEEVYFESTKESLIAKYGKGQLELFDISRYFRDIPNLPVVTLK